MTAADLSPDLDAIQARADAATEGPWHAGRGATSDGKESVRTYEQKAAFLALSLNEGESDLWLVDNDAVIPAATGDGPKAKANAEFIAHARTDVPALIALVREQRAQIGRVRDLHASSGGHNPACSCGVPAGAGANCVECGDVWPCPTVAALTATEGA